MNLTTYCPITTPTTNSTIYCPITICHSFIPTHAIIANTGTCPTCHIRFCTLCRTPLLTPTVHVHPTIPAISHAKSVQASQENLIKTIITMTEQYESEEQKFISRLIRENAKAERNIPSGLDPAVEKKYKEDLRERHWMLCEEARSLFERMVEIKRKYELELRERMDLD